MAEPDNPDESEDPSNPDSGLSSQLFRLISVAVLVGFTVLLFIGRAMRNGWSSSSTIGMVGGVLVVVLVAGGTCGYLRLNSWAVRRTSRGEALFVSGVRMPDDPAGLSTVLVLPDRLQVVVGWAGRGGVREDLPWAGVASHRMTRIQAGLVAPWGVVVRRSGKADLPLLVRSRTWGLFFSRRTAQELSTAIRACSGR